MIFWEKLKHVYRVIFCGASEGQVRKRTGNKTKDWFSKASYNWSQFLDKLYTILFFRGRKYQTKTGRVRSKAEKRIANFLTDQGVDFQYERPLALLKAGQRPTLKKRVIIMLLNQGYWLPKSCIKKHSIVLCHPDFYLTRYKVWVEYWGMMGWDANYEQIHKLKMALYKEHNVRMISIYPKDLKNLANVLASQFQKITGKNLPTQDY